MHLSFSLTKKGLQSNKCISLEPLLKDVRQFGFTPTPLEVNRRLPFNFHLINFIKFADDAKLGGVVSTWENWIRIRNALDSV